MWFPKPTTSADLEIIGTSRGLSVQALFDLLHAPEAVEWKEKVGVVTPADGSAKATTRLLKSQEWVFKTDIGQQTFDKSGHVDRLHTLADIAQSVELWHPEKFWFLLRCEGQWLPVSACPLLTTIRAIEEWDIRIGWWSRMIMMGLRLSFEHAIGLDLNPSNFAFDDPMSDHLFYVDDELYGSHDCFDIAESIVSRLPEEPGRAPEQWTQWGSQLKQVLHDFCQGHATWRHFLDGIREYPLTGILEPQRTALLRGLTTEERVRPVVKAAPEPQARRAEASAAPLQAQAVSPTPSSMASPTPLASVRSRTGRTCIFADVHANLPALEAMLAFLNAAGGVERYVFLGDVVSYGPFPRQCVQRIAEMENVILLRGNHDNTSGTGIPENGSNRLARQIDMWTYQQLTPAERDWLLALPVEYVEQPWMGVHGAPQDPHKFYAYVYELTYQDNLDYVARQHCSLCFYGHTHVQFAYWLSADGTMKKFAPETLDLFREGESMLINPGSVGQPRDGDPRTAFAIWDHDTNRITFHRIKYPVAVTVEAVKREGLPEDLVYRLEEGR